MLPIVAKAAKLFMSKDVQAQADAELEKPDSKPPFIVYMEIIKSQLTQVEWEELEDVGLGTILQTTTISDCIAVAGL